MKILDNIGFVEASILILLVAKLWGVAQLSWTMVMAPAIFVLFIYGAIFLVLLCVFGAETAGETLTKEKKNER